jgi:hypothetical protein
VNGNSFFGRKSEMGRAALQEGRFLAEFLDLVCFDVECEHIDSLSNKEVKRTLVGPEEVEVHGRAPVPTEETMEVVAQLTLCLL